MNRKTVPNCPSSPDEIAAHEFEAYMGSQDPDKLAAAEWHTRREQGLDAREEAEFQQWLSTSPKHKTAFDRIEEDICLLRNLPAEQVAHLRNPTNAAPVSEPSRFHLQTSGNPSTSHRPEIARRWLGPFESLRQGAPRFRPIAVALCCVTILALGVGWHQWRQPTFTGTYAAERGQHLDVSLPDGSNLAIDADTRIEVQLYRDRREVRMEHGQAMFSVAADSAKPFEVLAGPARVKVVGTRFSVRYVSTGASAGNVDVAVEEGRVQVAPLALERNPATEDSRFVELAADQEVQISSSGSLSEISPVSSGSIAPWRKGLVRFSNTPLADALIELERYGPTNLVIRDPDVAALRIGGSYQIGNPDAFARVLPQILPVLLVAREDKKTEIVKAP